jgi:NAD(P)-dependent dehydrogenase (short-subunit alcohol dehydrogenase family)
MSLTIDLSGRSALVTGGSRGIGRAVAVTLGRGGANVVVGGTRETARLREVVRELRDLGSRAFPVTGDLGLEETATRYVEVCRDELGGLDILVNNAGIWEETEIDGLTPAHLERTLRLNLSSVFLLCRHAVPLLKGSEAGRIINISSTASLLGEPLHAPYAASKGGLDALTRSLAVELGPFGVTVNSVAPGWTRTEMTEADLGSDRGKRLVAEMPLRKVAEPEDVAHAVAYLASDWGGHVTGVTLPVEGGYRYRR